MAFGLNLEGGGGGGDIMPIIKYDARSGRIFRSDYANGERTAVDITQTFAAIFDFENVEAGYIDFNTGHGPDFVVARLGDRAPDRPKDGKHQQGVRLQVKLSTNLGGDVRELATTANAALRGFDAAHTAYEAEKAQHPGMLPVLVLESSTPVTTGEGQKKATNYTPNFKIVRWIARPADLVYKPRAKAAAPAGATGGTPPATGATRVPPPTQPAASADFGDAAAPAQAAPNTADFG